MPKLPCSFSSKVTSSVRAGRVMQNRGLSKLLAPSGHGERGAADADATATLDVGLGIDAVGWALAETAVAELARVWAVRAADGLGAEDAAADDLAEAESLVGLPPASQAMSESNAMPSIRAWLDMVTDA